MSENYTPTEEEKEGWLKYVQKLQERSFFLQVVYNPSCGCPIDQMVLLDRFPMSTKIICGKCPECKKGCVMEISDPITFHDPLQDVDLTLEELYKCVIPDSEQAHVIRKYQQYFHLSRMGK